LLCHFNDFDAYRQRLQQFVYHSGTLMKPVFATARTVASDRRRIILCEGEDERVLRAAQIAVDEKLARPILVGRPKAIEQSIRNQGLRLRAGRTLHCRRS
jgi:malate dehydrogenase (oxaloacetate-decarboxylating)(NADP+)